MSATSRVSSSTPRAKQRFRMRLLVEVLEDRVAPATFSTAGRGISIHVGRSEQMGVVAVSNTKVQITDSQAVTDPGIQGVTVQGNTIVIDETQFGSVAIVDDGTGANAGVAFTDSGANAYSIPLSVALTNAASGNVTFAGANTFAGADLSVQTAGGSILSTATSTLSLKFGNGATSNLALTAGNDVALIGLLNVAGTTALDARGNIYAPNSGNTFGGDLVMTEKITIHHEGMYLVDATGPLTLGNCNFTLGTSGPDSLIAATGNITLDPMDAITGSSAGPAVNFRSATGNIDLTGNGQNDFTFPIGAAVAGNNTIVLANLTATELANITAGAPTGATALSVTSGGTISQLGSSSVPTTFQPGTAITCPGPAGFFINGGSGDIDLDQPGNNFGSVVTFDAVGGGVLDRATLVNVNPHAQVPRDREASVPSVSELTLSFESTGLLLPAVAVGTLNVTANGPITQSAPITTTGNASFTVTGDYPVTLSNGQNSFGGDLSVIGPNSSQPATVASSAAIDILSFSWGIGGISISSGGDIVEDTAAGASFTQEQGAAPVVLTANAPNANVALVADTAAGDFNDFTNYVLIQGKDVANVAFENADPRATIDSLATPTTTGLNTTDGLTLPSTVTSLALQFDNAPIDFDKAAATAGLQKLLVLSVTAQGVRSDPGTSTLTMLVSNPANQASFNAGTMPIDLVGNGVFNNVTFSNSGPNAVIVNNTGNAPLNFTGDTELGYGPLTLTSAAGISEDGKGDIVQAAIGDINGDGIPDLVQLVSAGGPISIGSQANEFTGAICVGSSASPQTQNVTLTNGTDDLVLGNCFTTGQATFTATSIGGGIRQAPGAALQLGGNATFTAAADIRLGSAKNGYGGTDSLSCADCILDGSSALTFGAVNAVNLTVQTTGAISQAPGTAITVSGEASFSAGSNNITLDSQKNSIPLADMNGDGKADVIATAGDLTLNHVTLGATALTINAGGNLFEQPGGAVTQTGAAPISITAGAIDLGNSGNNFQGTVTVRKLPGRASFQPIVLDCVANLTVNTDPGVTFDSDLNLTAGGTVTLPTTPLTSLSSLQVSARQTLVTSGITVTGTNALGNAISFTGAVTLATPTVTPAAPLVIDASAADANVTFNGDVTVTGTGGLNFAMGNKTSIILQGGTWNEGANTLDLTAGGGSTGVTFGEGVTLDIGTPGASGPASPPAVFAMTGGDLDEDGTSDLVMVNPFATLSIGSQGGGGAVNFNLGDGNLVFTAGSTYEFGQGTTNSVLDMNGDGRADLTAGPALYGNGLAASTATPILATTTAGAAIVTNFQPGTAQVIDDGSDIVTVALEANLDQQGGTFNPGGDFVLEVGGAGPSPVGTPLSAGIVTVSTNGKFSGYTAAGDPIAVTATTTPSGGVTLAVLQTPTGFSFCIRKEVDASSPQLFNVAVTHAGGTGVAQINNFADWGTGPLTINAPSCRIGGSGEELPKESLEFAFGSIAKITVGQIGSDSGSPTFVVDGGSAATAITAGAIANATISLQGPLSLTATSVDGECTLAAPSFGAITTTGNAATGDAGDFAAVLYCRKQGGGIQSVNVAGNLSGDWNVQGDIGSVTARSTGSGAGKVTINAFNITRIAGTTINIGSLSLGIASDFTVDAGGNIGSVTAGAIVGVAGPVGVVGSSIDASSIGSITATGGAFVSRLLEEEGIYYLTVQLAGTLGALNVAGNLDNTTITGTTANATVGSVSVSGAIDSGGISGVTSIASVSAAEVNNWSVEAGTLSIMKVLDKASPLLYGSITNSHITLSGTTGVTLGSLSTAGGIAGSTIDVQQGGVGSITTGDGLVDDSITLDDPATGNLGSITTGSRIKVQFFWDRCTVSAASIGSISVLSGNLDDSTIVEFGQEFGPQASSKRLTATALNVSGGMDSDTFVIPNGISTSSAGQIVSCNFLEGDPDRPIVVGAAPNTVGAIGTLTAGAMTNTVVAANVIGTINITGPVGVTGCTFVGSSMGATTFAIGTITVAGGVDAATSITSLGGIAKMVIGNTYRDIVSDPEWTWGVAPNPNAGTLGSLTAGAIDGAIIHTAFIGSLNVTGNASAGLAGTVSDAIIDAIGAAAAAPAIGTIAVASDCDIAALLAWGHVNNVSVGGKFLMKAKEKANQVKCVALGIAPAGPAPTGLGTLTAAGMADVTLVTQSCKSMAMNENPTESLVGAVEHLTLNVLGSSKGIGLGSFTATGPVTNSLLEVAAGSVGSFKAAAFLNSDLLVGAQLPNANDPHGTPPTFTGAFSIGSFQTTAPFNAADVADSASFQDSTIAAAALGTITLSGVNPLAAPGSGITSFGIFFSNGKDGGKTEQGVVFIDAHTTRLVPSAQPQSIGTPPQSGAFFYEGFA